MFPLQIPAFGEAEYFDNQENKAARVVLIPQVNASSFQAYHDLLLRSGFVCREQENLTHRQFAAYEKDGWGVFVNYFANTAQLQLVMEENTNYFSYSDTCGPVCTTPRLTQVYLSDYGLSDVIRLSDGRLIVIDGANVYEKDVDHLFERMKKDSPAEKPVIAAWIMTHPHSDHFFCFFPFMKKYAQEVTVERFFFNFPEGDDLEHYPKLAADKASFAKWSGIEDIKACDIVGMFRRDIEEMGIPVYVPHTGQRYTVGDAKLQFMASMDDSIHCSQNINATSLIFFMELAGQKILFTGDASFSDTMTPQRYGYELKADILQAPHHGFGCGTAAGEIAAYRLIAPPVCLLPVERRLAYRSFCTYKEGTRYLLTKMNIQEMRTGETDQTLELPYTANPAAEGMLEHQYLEGRDSAGAHTWMFTDLNTANKEDFMFSVVNTTFINANLSVELYFENMQRKVVRVKNKGLRMGMFRLNCLLTPEEDQTLFDDPDFLASKGVPENTNFAVRFISDIPVVISHREHSPAYRSSII